MAETLNVWGTKDFHTSLQLILAKRLGFFQQMGMAVKCTLFPSEDALTARLEKFKEKPFVWTQTAPLFLRLRAKGEPIKILCPLADISASFQVVVRQDAHIVLPANLEDRKIGIVSGSLIDIAFRNMAKDFDVDLSKIQFVNAMPVKQLELFVDGEIDAVACWEPWTTQAQYVGGAFYFSGVYSAIPGHERPVNWLTGQSMLVTYEDSISADAEKLLAILKALHQATMYINKTLRKAASVLSDMIEVDYDTLVALLQNNRYTMTIDENFTLGLVSIRNMMRSLSENIGTIPPVSELYDTRLLRQLDPMLVQLTIPAKPARQVQIVTEGTIYYPDGVTISHTDDSPLRYLIVDDTQVMVDLFSSIVENMNGIVAGTASTGAEGLFQYVELLPDVVVMDISMPDMNGIDAIRRILTIHPAANIIVMSGNNYEETRRQLFELGVKAFIGKPFHVDQIMTVLSKLV